ncbi:MAG: hypothetical protein JJ902_04225 [Roseibium sp.]|nr:hypothetical protein [Roseibium sp.]
MPDAQFEAMKISKRLEAHYTAREIDQWLSRPHPQLDGATAYDAIAAGEHAKVNAIIDREDILRRWREQNFRELSHARTMRDQWQREVERLEKKQAGLETDLDY